MPHDHARRLEHLPRCGNKTAVRKKPLRKTDLASEGMFREGYVLDQTDRIVTYERAAA